MAKTNVKSYKRKDGTNVKAHSRKKNSSLSFSKKNYYQDKNYLRKKGAFELPVESAIYVPSTKGVDQVISKKEFEKRIMIVKNYLARKYGGFSSVRVVGGYYSDDKGKVVMEDVVRVVFYSTEEAWKSNRSDLYSKLKQWGEIWGQESMGLEHEGDLYYV